MLEKLVCLFSYAHQSVGGERIQLIFPLCRFISESCFCVLFTLNRAHIQRQQHQMYVADSVCTVYPLTNTLIFPNWGNNHCCSFGSRINSALHSKLTQFLQVSHFVS